MTTHHPIAIIGGGLGGLTTARVLHTRGVTSAIFELEPNRQARVQGGMLDIHESNGQQAVHAADLWEPFTKIIHHGGESTRVLDSRATVLRDERDTGELKRPEVDRGQLRDLLIDSLPEGTIRGDRCPRTTVLAVHPPGDLGVGAGPLLQSPEAPRYLDDTAKNSCAKAPPAASGRGRSADSDRRGPARLALLRHDKTLHVCRLFARLPMR